MRSPASRFRALLALIAVCLVVSLSAGCYTTLRHPGAADLSGEYNYEDKSCYDCHDEASFYHSYYGVYFDYYYDSPWFGYYSDPWWYDSYWRGGNGRGSEQQGYDSNERHQWNRGSPSGAPRGSSGFQGSAPYLREDYIKNSPKPSQPPSQPDKPQEKKNEESDKKRTTGQRGKKK